MGDELFPMEVFLLCKAANIEGVATYIEYNQHANYFYVVMELPRESQTQRNLLDIEGHPSEFIMWLIFSQVCALQYQNFRSTIFLIILPGEVSVPLTIMLSAGGWDCEEVLWRRDRTRLPDVRQSSSQSKWTREPCNQRCWLLKRILVGIHDKFRVRTWVVAIWAGYRL